jgi:hypothetical protein
MRKVLTSAAMAALVALGLAACDPQDKGDTEVSEQSWSDADPNTPPTDPPRWDAEYKSSTTTLDVTDHGEPSTGTNVQTGELTSTEAARLAAWDGRGDAPFGDDATHDGRFSDVTCGPTGRPVNGYTGGLACSYADGMTAVEGIDYRGGVWVWGAETLSAPGQCPEESDCGITWSYETTSPVVVEG